LIVAADEKDIIGREGRLPWYLPEDLKRFKRLTQGHVVVVGRSTNDSIVERLGGPLPDRTSVVVTRQTGLASHPDVIYQHDVESALDTAEKVEAGNGMHEVFVIGGAEIYRLALPRVQRIYLTRVRGSFDGDCGLSPDWLGSFRLSDEDPHEEFTFLTYERG
jgi:dihydrofolate reductase